MRRRGHGAPHPLYVLPGNNMLLPIDVKTFNVIGQWLAIGYSKSRDVQPALIGRQNFH